MNARQHITLAAIAAIIMAITACADISAPSGQVADTIAQQQALVLDARPFAAIIAEGHAMPFKLASNDTSAEYVDADTVQFDTVAKTFARISVHRYVQPQSTQTITYVKRGPYVFDATTGDIVLGDYVDDVGAVHGAKARVHGDTLVREHGGAANLWTYVRRR